MRISRFSFVAIFIAAVVGYVLFTQSNGVFSFNLGVDKNEAGIAPISEYFRARVVSVVQEQREPELSLYNQTLAVQGVSGSKKGEDLQLEHRVLRPESLLVPGQVVVVGVLQNPDEAENPLLLVDVYRLPWLGLFVLLFLILAVVFARGRGVSALIGLVFTVWVLLTFFAPAMLAGASPVWTTLWVSIVIAVVSLYLAHGFNVRSTLAVVSPVLSLGVAQGLAYLAVHVLRLWGSGSEEVFILQAASGGLLDMRGLLFAGVVIGCLGVLDDVTTAQTAVVGELHAADAQLPIKRLVAKGMVVGREHIASLINTLFLAYVGAFLPFFLLLVAQNTAPLWVVLSGERVAEEIMRAIVGGVALVVAVPLSTFVAALYIGRQPK